MHKSSSAIVLSRDILNSKDEQISKVLTEDKHANRQLETRHDELWKFIFHLNINTDKHWAKNKKSAIIMTIKKFKILSSQNLASCPMDIFKKSKKDIGQNILNAGLCSYQFCFSRKKGKDDGQNIWKTGLYCCLFCLAREKRFSFHLSCNHRQFLNISISPKFKQSLVN